LLAALKARFPQHRLLLSTTTLTGHAVAQAGVRGVDGLFFAPFDFRRPVRRVLDALQPELVVLVETELWPNLIHAARRRGIRVAVVNGRLSPRSVGRYRLVRALLRHVLAEVDTFLMQAEPHARRLLELGAPPERVRVSGNLKFDAPAPVEPPAELAARLDGRRPLIVAGSTVEGEEELVLQAFAQVRARHAEAHLLIAPRHPERFERVPPLVEAAGWPCLRRSALGAGGWGEQVLLLDTLGELASVYALARVVFVGGSLVPKGGHNVLEPALFGRAVVVGPHMQNFQEIADAFLAERALVQVRSGDELGPALLALLEDDARREALGAAARGLVERNRGAVARTVEALAELVS
jgi:3-deoxy-D-manno-octulosonic-acid transferase